MPTRPETLCPSAQPDWEGARVIGVVGGTPERPQTAYLDQAQPVTQEILDLAGPVAPAEVFRFAAPCAGSACGHYDGEEHKCRLAEKTVRWVEQGRGQPAEVLDPRLVPVVAAGRAGGLQALPAGGHDQLRAQQGDARRCRPAARPEVH